MKFNILIVSALLIYSTAFSQVGEWVWIHGDSAANSAGNFGTQGVPSPSNEPPSFYEACEWTDFNGNFWLFGGESYAGTYGDLWKYDPNINQWIWMKGPGTSNHQSVCGSFGVPSPANYPSSRFHAVVSWVDSTGNFWMMGGQGNDGLLWKYIVATNEWTCIRNLFATDVFGTRGIPAPANTPSWYESENPAAWTDNAGDLWFYSGVSTSDMWRYNIASNNWTWMQGPDTGNWTNPAIYGTKGIEDSTNTPGDRWAYAHWKDNSGKLWMFGGNSIPIKNDMWRYNTATNNWTWMNGDSSHTMGSYGIKSVSSPSNIPPARLENRAVWTDQCGNFWMFGGGWEYNGFGAKCLNDLWKFNPDSNQWTWISGDSTVDPVGNWGTLGVSSPTNKPNGRVGAVGWSRHDSTGADQFYVFGGGSGIFNLHHNDLWKFTMNPCIAGLQASFISSDTAFCNESGQCISFFDHSTGNPTSWQWQFTGANPSSSNQQNPTNICYTTPGTYPVTLIVSNGTITDTLNVSPLILYGTTLPQPTIIVRGGDTLVSSHGSTYQWYLNGSPITGATDSIYVAYQAGTYAVQITDSTGGCNSISNGLAMGMEELTGSGGISIYPNPASQSVIISWQSAVGGRIEISVVNVLGEKVYSEQQQIANSKLQLVLNVSSLTNGIYFLKIESGERIIIKKFVIMHK